MTLASKFSDKLLYLFAVSMTLTIFQYHRIPVSLVLLLFYMVLVHGKDINVKLNRDNIIFLILGCLSIVSTFICLTSEMNNSWKLSGVFNEGIFLILVVYKLFYSEHMATVKLDIVTKGLKVGCLINLFWCYFQLALYNLTKIDINDLIFHKTLKLMETASAYRNGVDYCVTGLGWHPGQLVPIIILLFFMFDSFIIRLLVLGVCVFSNNSTCLVTGMLCVLGVIAVEMIKGKGNIEGKKIASSVILLLALVVATLIKNDFLLFATDKIAGLFDRLGQVLQPGEIEDKSTYLHARYYSYYPNIVEKQNVFENLFGLGYECSGYPYTKYLDQFTSLNDWIPETDYMNFIIGRGWIWTLLYYFWMLKGSFKARRVSPFYLLFTLIVMMCGVMYNNQFFWVVIAEMIMIEAGKQEKNIWNKPVKLRFPRAGR